MNGSSWTVQAIPNPSGTQGSGLPDVSCPSASACTEVDSYTNSKGVVLALAERWNGSSWTVQDIPNPSRSQGSGLSDVSCPSVPACTAIGDYTTSARGVELPLAERWNGSSWKLQVIPNLSASQGGQLSDVSCASLIACTAVGFYTNSKGVVLALAEGWNGATWTVQTIALPAGDRFHLLRAVSCPLATACTAIVWYDNSKGVVLALAERWNGDSWKVQAIHLPSGAESGRLFDLSCPSLTACTAVGLYFPRHHSGLALADRWNGS